MQVRRSRPHLPTARVDRTLRNSIRAGLASLRPRSTGLVVRSPELQRTLNTRCYPKQKHWPPGGSIDLFRATETVSYVDKMI